MYLPTPISELSALYMACILRETIEICVRRRLLRFEAKFRKKSFLPEAIVYSFRLHYNFITVTGEKMNIEILQSMPMPDADQILCEVNQSECIFDIIWNICRTIMGTFAIRIKTLYMLCIDRFKIPMTDVIPAQTFQMHERFRFFQNSLTKH